MRERERERCERGRDGMKEMKKMDVAMEKILLVHQVCEREEGEQWRSEGRRERGGGKGEGEGGREGGTSKETVA